MFSPSEWRILVVLTALFLSGAGWHLVEANVPLPPLRTGGQVLVWNDPAESAPVAQESEKDGKQGARPGKTSRKPMLTGLVNPNTASSQALQALPGVGEKMAQRIVDERANGPFKDLEDLQRVKGIGAKKAEKMRPWLRFD
ncbi:MAG: hypothetical protein RL318_292 [Fibrobacterota bacterium]